MRGISFIVICIAILFSNKLISQSDYSFEGIFTEYTTEQQKFSIYLDSIDKYLYRDINITSLAFEECEKIIKQGTALSKSQLFDYKLSKIYHELNNQNPLAAYELVLDSEVYLSNSDKIPPKDITNYKYIKGYTLMTIGDYEAAQKIFYDNIELGRLANDTLIMISNLYSLGQLYSYDNDNQAAIKCFLQNIEYLKVTKSRPTTIALNDFELCESYYESKDYDKALRVINRAFRNYLEKEKMNVLMTDFLFIKGDIYLAQNKIDSAQYVYEQLLKLNEDGNYGQTTTNNMELLAKLYVAKKAFPQAHQIYQEIVERLDSTNFKVRLSTFQNLHTLNKKMGRFEKAYNYLSLYNEVKYQVDEDAKRQKTAYLKIKYDSEQKEKENTILSAEIMKKQSEQKLLYGLIILFGLFFSILIWAFYQKNRYNKKLEADVEKRTLNLKKTNEKLSKVNKEVDEFNRILSHDLKEPLRSIVGFSQLASKEVGDAPKIKEYLAYITNGGIQLSELIEDVSTFRNASFIDVEKSNFKDIQIIIDNNLQIIQNKYTEKNIDLEYHELPKILVSTNIFDPIFNILFDNAVKYNTQQKVQIAINYRLKDQMHNFEIQDNGIGIAADYHRDVFHMFKRLNTRDVYNGSGLGLSIARKLIEKIDGNISILSSQKNKGSTFLLRFPIQSIDYNKIAKKPAYNELV